MAEKAWWEKAIDTVGKAGVKAKNAVESGAKKAVAAVDDALVPGEGKASNIGRDAKKVYQTMRGTQPPLKKPGGENGES